MDALDEILDAQTHPGVFHPVHLRDPQAWFPGNEAASLLLQSQYIWEDIQHLADMRRTTHDEYRKKLLLKYVFIELRSLIEVFDTLQGKVMKAEVFDPADRANRPYRGVTQSESRRAKELYKTYTTAKAATEQAIIQVRNNIGAHRGNVNWQEVMGFWDAISMTAIQPVLDSIPPVFEHVKELNIYEWNRLPRDGAIEIIGSAVYPDDLEPEDSRA